MLLLFCEGPFFSACEHVLNGYLKLLILCESLEKSSKIFDLRVKIKPREKCTAGSPHS